ncbi:MAG: DUF1573 domain-containing protein [Planctomycetes bacterium]|nr:DUF1573 domain-containing protein [Planctomycetota bacterium]
MKLKKTFLTIVIVAIALTLQSGCQEKTKTAPEQQKVELKTTAKTAPIAKPVKAPKVQVENPVVDFGVMGPNKRKTGKYNFKNVGQGILKITKIRSTCGCTVPDPVKKEYAPGESGTIAITYRSSTRKGVESKHLYIESNDPENPKFELTVKANIKLSIEATPIRLGLSTRQKAIVPPITIKSKDGKPFAIRSFSCTKGVISAKFDSTVSALEFVLEPIVDYEKLKDNLRGVIKIAVTHPFTKEVSIPYVTKAEFEVTRPRIIIQNAEPGQTIKKDLWITSNYQQMAEVETITIEKGHIEIASKENNGNDLKIVIDITVPPKKGKSRYFSDTVDIKLKTGQKFKVRCNGFYKRDIEL